MQLSLTDMFVYLIPTKIYINSLLIIGSLDKADSCNYRSISNLNNISKIVKHLMLTRFRSHVTYSPNFNEYQSAYRPHYSTETALMLTLDSIYNSADLGKSTLLIFLDHSAACGTIDHFIRLGRLKISFGIDGPVINWI